MVMVDCRMIDHIRYTVRGKQESGDDGREWDNCATAAAKPAGCQMIDRTRRIQRRELENRSAAAVPQGFSGLWLHFYYG